MQLPCWRAPCVGAIAGVMWTGFSTITSAMCRCGCRSAGTMRNLSPFILSTPILRRLKRFRHDHDAASPQQTIVSESARRSRSRSLPAEIIPPAPGPTSDAIFRPSRARRRSLRRWRHHGILRRWGREHLRELAGPRCNRGRRGRGAPGKRSGCESPCGKGACGAAGPARFSEGAGSVANIRVNSPGVCSDRLGGGGVPAKSGSGPWRGDASPNWLARIMRVNSLAGWGGGAARVERIGWGAKGDCIIRVNSPGALARGGGGGAGAIFAVPGPNRCGSLKHAREFARFRRGRRWGRSLGFWGQVNRRGWHGRWGGSLSFRGQRNRRGWHGAAVTRPSQNSREFARFRRGRRWGRSLGFWGQVNRRGWHGRRWWCTSGERRIRVNSPGSGADGVRAGASAFEGR